MYKTFFELKELPFRNNLDSNFFYKKASRLEILNALIYVIQRGDAVIKVTGEVGSGKTTLLRLTSLALSEGFELIYINAPNLTPKDLLFSIATELQIPFSESDKKFQLLHLIRDKLLEHHFSDTKVVVLVDEAQSMSVDTLEELRLLTNLETEKDKLIQLVLFGQDELDVALDKQALRQLKSRITYNIHIPPLTNQDVYDYLNHRMRVAEYKGLDFFSFKDAKRIQQLSNGLPRTINAIADQLLMAAFGSGDRKLKRQHYKNLSTVQLYYDQPVVNPYFFVGIFILLALLFSSWYFLVQSNYFGEPVQTSSVIQDKPWLEKPVEVEKFKNEPDLDEPEIVKLEATPENVTVEQVELNPEILVTKDTPTEVNEVKSPSEKLDEAVTTLFDLHKDTELWLKSLGDTRYVIQLSTSTPDDYTRLLQTYSKSETVIKNVHFMLALNNNESRMILKSLYLADSSYTKLSNELLQLPKSIQVSKPFIVRLSSLKSNAVLTTQKLEAMKVQ